MCLYDFKKENAAIFSTLNFYGCSPITSSIEEWFFKFDLFERLHYWDGPMCWAGAGHNPEFTEGIPWLWSKYSQFDKPAIHLSIRQLWMYCFKFLVIIRGGVYTEYQNNKVKKRWPVSKANNYKIMILYLRN